MRHAAGIRREALLFKATSLISDRRPSAYQFSPLRRDDGGTVSGRFSSTHHNIPARDPELGPLIKSLFLPEEGEDWACLDYSQIEPRIQFHYAKGPRVEALRQRYQENPALDCYREMMMDIDIDIDRDSFKAVWLGISYGMGLASTARNQGVDISTAKAWRESFPPYITALAKSVGQRAAARSFIKTLLGRRARFNQWEASDWETAQIEGCMSHEKALEKYGNKIRRAMTHKALNRLAQGSAADIMKKALLDIWQSGICDILGPPKHCIHDELDWSVPRTEAGREALLEAKRLMERAVSLKVPLLVKQETGRNWGDL